MAEIDERIVSMKFDNRQFENGVSTSISTIDKLKKALDFSKQEQQFAELEKTANNVSFSDLEKTLKNIQFWVDPIGNHIKNEIGSALNWVENKVTSTWSALTNQIVSGGKSRAMNIANAKFQLEGLGVAWADIYDDISYGVDATAYGLDAAAVAASQLVASGVEFGKAFGTTGNSPMAKALRGISGVAAMTNSSFEEISRIFTTVAGQGRIMGDQLNQLASRGLNVAADLAKVYGVTEQELRDMVSKGQVSFKEFSEAMDNAYGAHAKEANKTFNGALSNMKSALSRIGELFATPAYDSLIGPLNKLKDMFNEVKKSIAPLAGDDGIVTKLIYNAAELASLLTEKLQPAVKFYIDENIPKIKKVGAYVNNIIDGWKKVLETTSFIKTDKIKSLTEASKDLSDAERRVAEMIWVYDNYSTDNERKKEIATLGLSYENVQMYIEQIIAGTYDWEKATKEATGESEKAIDNLELEKAAKFSAVLTHLFKTVKYIAKGAYNLVQAAKNILVALGKSFIKTFDLEPVGEDLEDLSDIFLYLTSKIREATEDSEGLGKVFDKIFGALNTVYTVVRSIVRGMATILGGIGDAITWFKESLDSAASSSDTLDRKTRFFKTLSKVIEDLKDWVKKTKDEFIDFVTTFKDTERGQRVIDIFTKLRDVLKDLSQHALDWVLDKFEKLAEKGFEVPDFGEILDRLLKLPKFIEYLGNKFGMAKNEIFEFFSSLDNEDGTPAQKLLGSIANLVGDLFSKDTRKKVAERVKDLWGGILDGLSSVSFSDILGATNLLLMIRLVHSIVTTLESFKKTTKGFKTSILGVIDGLTDIETAFANSIKADVAKKLAVSIAIIAGAIFALTMVDQGKLMTATSAILIVMIALKGVVEGIAKIGAKTKISNVTKEFSDNVLVSLQATWLTLVAVAGVIVAVVHAMVAIVNIIKDGNFLENLVYLGLTMATLTALLAIVAVFVGIMGRLTKNIDPKSMLGILALGATFYVLAKAFEVINNVVEKADDWRESMLALLGITVAMMGLAYASQKAKSLVGVGVGLIALAAGFTALIAPLSAFMGLILYDGAAFLKALVAMGAALGILTAVSILLDKFGGGGKQLLTMSAAITSIGLSMLMMGAAITLISKHLISFLAVIGALVVLSALSIVTAAPFLKFGVAVESLGAGLALMAASALIFAVGVYALGKALPVLGSGFIEMITILNNGKSQIMAALGDLIEAMAYTLTESIPYIVTFVGKLILGILEGFRDGLKDLLIVIVDILDTIVMFLFDIMDPLVDKICKVLASFFYALATSISRNAGDLGKSIAYCAEALITVVMQAIETVLADGLRALATMWNSVWNFFTGKDAFADLDFIDDMDKAMEDWVEEKSQKFADAEDSFKRVVEEAGKTTADAYGKGIKEGTAQNDASYYASIYGGKAAEKGAEQGAENVKSAMFSGFGDGEIASFLTNQLQMGNVSMFSNFEDMTSMCQQYSIEIPESLQNEAGFEDAMSNNNTAWNKEFESNFPQTKEEGKQMSEEGANGAGSQTWRYARSAQNCCDAFMAVLWKNRERLYERGQQCAQAAAEGFEKELEIESPSKRFMRNGEFTVLGFVEGLKNNEKLAEASSEDLGNAVVSSFSTPLDKIAAILRGEEEYDPTIRPVLDLTSVREGANEINGLFANRSVELASINGSLNANNLAAQRALDVSNQNGSKDIVAAIGLMRGDINALNETMANTELVMDSGAVVGAIKRPMDNALGKMNMFKGRRN